MGEGVKLLLLRHDTDVNSEDNYGGTPLLKASVETKKPMLHLSSPRVSRGDDHLFLKMILITELGHVYSTSLSPCRKPDRMRRCKETHR
jgi:hypothetical protein